MTEQEILCTMALARLPHLNVSNQQLLLKEMGSAVAVFEQRNAILELLPKASPKLKSALDGMETQLERAREELDFAKEKQINCLCFNDMDYPTRLRECEDAPILLFYKGNANLNTTHVVNMVGTRHCTEYGKEICRHFLAELKRFCPDVLVISGLAYGIDIHSHRYALANDLKTVGVLAHGLDQIYPRTHRDTAIEMIQKGGLLTEFMSRTNADKVNFIRRNRIVAGIADATIVIESAKKGGALITAGIAESYHRDVFAFPGRVSDPYSQGCNNLIRDNRAVILQNASDFVNSMGWTSSDEYETARKNPIQRNLFPNLDEEEQAVVKALQGSECKQINALAIECNFAIYKISAILFNLEMKGVVKLLNGGMYKLLT